MNILAAFHICISVSSENVKSTKPIKYVLCKYQKLKEVFYDSANASFCQILLVFESLLSLLII